STLTVAPFSTDNTGNHYILDSLGRRVDTNENAGLSVLRGFDPTSSAVVPAVYPAGNINLFVPNNTPVPITSTITIPDSFPIQNVTVQVNINTIYDPGLTGVLVGPDGTQVTLFSGDGSFGLSGPA